MRLSLRAIREGQRSPPWSGPVYYDYMMREVVYAPIPLHWLLRVGRWVHNQILTLAHRPNFDDVAIQLIQAERIGYSRGFRRGANEAQRWISGALQALAERHG